MTNIFKVNPTYGTQFVEEDLSYEFDFLPKKNWCE